jgi:hypothetical protein
MHTLFRAGRRGVERWQQAGPRAAARAARRGERGSAALGGAGLRARAPAARAARLGPGVNDVHERRAERLHILLHVALQPGLALRLGDAPRGLLQRRQRARQLLAQPDDLLRRARALLGALWV